MAQDNKKEVHEAQASTRTGRTKKDMMYAVVRRHVFTGR